MLFFRYFLLMLTLCFWAAASQACDCPSVPIDTLRARATHIFVGKVVRVETNWMSGGMKYTFQVSQTWGKASDNMRVVNSAFVKQCGYPFREGETYLVYAKKKFSLRTDACGGSKPLSAAAADLAILGKGQAIGELPNVARLWWQMSACIVLGLIFLAVVVLRGKFRRKP